MYKIGVKRITDPKFFRKNLTDEELEILTALRFPLEEERKNLIYW